MGATRAGTRIGRLDVPHSLVLALVLVAAAAVRFAGIGWGANHYQHPDERFITMVLTGISWPAGIAAYFDTASSPLNPANNGYGGYLYGTFPLFLTKLLGNLTNHVAYGDAHLPGRWLSATADIGSVALVYWIARRLATSTAGLIAATLLAFTPLHIQASHFTTTDAISAFFAVASFAAVLHAWSRRSWRSYALAGLCVGLAVSSKPNLLITAGFLLIPIFETVRLHGVGALYPRRRGRLGVPVVLAVGLAGLVSLLTFRIAQPYSFVGPNMWNLRLDPTWTDTLRYWRDVQAGYIDMPPSVQWAGRPPMLFVLDNLVRWGMGPALGLATLASLVAVGWRMLVGRRWPSWWTLAIVAWVAWHLIFFGTGFVKAQRYLLPAYPFLILLAGVQLEALLRVGRRRFRLLPLARTAAIPALLRPEMLRRLGKALVVLVVAGTAFSGLAFTTIYSRPETRETASRWIYENVPVGSVIANEHWDDALPLSLPGYPTNAYAGVQLTWYDGDDEAKLSRLIGRLHRADYIVLSSDRLIGSIPRMPDRYPMATAYYEALVSGELGFDLVASFRSPPELFGIELDDRGAEESFSVYDHPYVRIFRKSNRWSTHDAWYLLHDALGDGGVNRRTIDPAASQMMLDESDRSVYAASGTWASMFDSDDLANAVPVVFWYLALLLVSLPAVPLLWRLFPRLPDRGYAIARTVGIYGVGWIAWMLASIRIARFGPTGILLALLIATVIGGLALQGRRGAFIDDLRVRWRWVIATEAIHLATFAGFVLLRMRNPDLWHPSRGGEKPMELAMFDAILRSPWFPPYDPWFAGGTLHYYYFGYVPWAAIARVTGIVPEMALNLTIPSIAALLAVAVWSGAAALVTHALPFRERSLGWRPILLALPAPVLVLVLGNLDFVRRIGRGEWGYLVAPSWLEPFGDLGSILWGIRDVLGSQRELPSDAYWAPSRVIPSTINEFPYFTFLFGDVHAHMLAMPVTSAAAVLAIGIATGGGSTRPGPGMLDTFGGWRSAVPVAVLAGLLPGMLLATNTWDYPSALALLGLAVIARALAVRGLSAPWLAFRDAAMVLFLIVASGRIFLWPFLSQYGSLPAQVLPGTETTRLADYLTINGVMLLAIAAWLIIELWRALGVVARWRRGRVIAVAVLVALLSIFAFTAMTGRTSLFLVGAIAAVAICAVARYRDPAHLLTLGMVGLAGGLALAAEFVRLGNDVGRMNLVFKLYLYAWQLLGVAATVGIVLALSRMRARPVATERRGEPRAVWASRLGLAAGRIWLVALAVLVIGALSYPILATAPRLRDRFASLEPSLDGFAYMQVGTWTEVDASGTAHTFPLAGDLAAIEWLRGNVKGSPVVLEAQLPAYRWGGRVSSTTGLPTVLGWTWHEIQQRPGYWSEVNERVEDVAEIYGSPDGFDGVRPLLERYGVRLIYVGPLERALYPATSLDKFDVAAASGKLDVVYDAGGVTIYAVPGSDLLLDRAG